MGSTSRALSCWCLMNAARSGKIVPLVYGFMLGNGWEAAEEGVVCNLLLPRRQHFPEVTCVGKHHS
jgi:hypothetical protein